CPVDYLDLHSFPTRRSSDLKTTIGRLLDGLFLPTEGRLLIDGVDIRQYHMAEVRAAVAVAGQSSDLFSGTVKENLLLGRADATRSEEHTSELQSRENLVCRL